MTFKKGANRMEMPTKEEALKVLQMTPKEQEKILKKNDWTHDMLILEAYGLKALIEAIAAEDDYVE
jgi:hypothetical protein